MRIDEIIAHDLAYGCQWRPTKRMVLQLAELLARHRLRACDLMRAKHLLSELATRVQRAKV